MVKVIASDVRKGNVIEADDGKLYTVLKAETYRPGKGTPTATVEMRRISDGVKVVETYKTTDQVERSSPAASRRAAATRARATSSCGTRTRRSSRRRCRGSCR